MKRLALSALSMALIGLACDEAAGPLRFEATPSNAPPRIASYLPPDTVLDTFVGETVSFSLQATDPDGDELGFGFFLDDSLVSNTPDWSYRVADVGRCRVHAEVSDGERAAAVDWQLTRYAAEGDPIEIVTFAPTAEPDVSILRWIAGRDSRGEPLDTFWVRTALAPITSEDAWNQGHTHIPVPPALAPGDTMTMWLHDLAPLQTHYVAVRGVDSRYHFTRLGASPSLVTPGIALAGVVTALPAWEPVPSVTVSLSAYETLSGADGRFALLDLPFISASLVARDDGTAQGVGTYYDYRRPYTTTWRDSVELYLLEDQGVQAAGYYANFLQMYRHLTDAAGSPAPTGTRRWEPPIALYVPPLTSGGLDYRATIVQVAEEINTTMNLTLFEIVLQPPPVGVAVVYSADAITDRFLMRERTADGYPLRGEVTIRSRYTVADGLEMRRNVRHELGHALGLNHSNAPAHLMYPLVPTRDDFHPDEIAVVWTLYAMPRGLDVLGFVND